MYWANKHAFRASQVGQKFGALTSARLPVVAIINCSVLLSYKYNEGKLIQIRNSKIIFLRLLEIFLKLLTYAISRIKVYIFWESHTNLKKFFHFVLMLLLVMSKTLEYVVIWTLHLVLNSHKYDISEIRLQKGFGSIAMLP